MITDRELKEYQSLCASLVSLHEKFLKRKQELQKLIVETAIKRKEALLVLARANRFTRYLSGNQRLAAGINYRLCEIDARINNTSPVIFESNSEEMELSCVLQTRDGSEVCRNSRELKKLLIAVIDLIDRIKRRLIQFEVLEKRCKELISSINKSLEAFNFEWRNIRRKIYPLGILSLFCRFSRRCLGKPYFSSRDMGDVAALGNLTGLVLKIADSAVY